MKKTRRLWLFRFASAALSLLSLLSILILAEYLLFPPNPKTFSQHLIGLLSSAPSDSDWFEGRGDARTPDAHHRFANADYTYHYDSRLRRVVPGISKEAKNSFVLFMGCSFVFGHGLNDEESLPFYFQSLWPESRVYNYGFLGAGPHSLLKRIENRPLFEEVSQGSGVVFFNFLPVQLHRVLGRAHTLAYQSGAPLFSWRDGKLVSLGSFRDVNPASTRVYEFFARSYVLRNLLPYPANSADDYRLYCRVLKKLKETVVEQLPAARFIVTNWFGQNGRPLEGCLAEEGVEFWNFDIPRDPALQNHWDGQHPSAFENKKFAELLVKRLREEEKNKP